MTFVLGELGEAGAQALLEQLSGKRGELHGLREPLLRRHAAQDPEDRRSGLWGPVLHRWRNVAAWGRACTDARLALDLLRVPWYRWRVGLLML